MLSALKKVKQDTVFKSNGELVGKGLLEGDFWVVKESVTQKYGERVFQGEGSACEKDPKN